MACGTVINLLTADRDLPVVDEGESADLVGMLKLGDRGVQAGEVASFRLTTYREKSKAKVIDDRDVLGSLATDGTFEITIGGADTAADPTTPENTTEWHVARLVWTWADQVSAKVRTGVFEGRFQVKRLAVL